MKSKLPEKLLNGTILIVDDLSFYISFVQQILTNNQFTGEIITAKSLEDSYEKIMSTYKLGKKIDLIITDLHLPDGEGLALAKKVRRTPQMAKTPVILITTEDNSKKVIESFEAGIDIYMFKPLEEEIFCEKVTFAYKKYNS